MSDPLSEALGRPAPPELASLPADAIDDLAAAVKDARRKQNVALADALDAALKIVPRPLRGPLKRVLT